jgi:hypothetical protein
LQVWAHGNQKVRNPDAPMARDKISDDKLAIFQQVSKSCDKLIPKLTNAEKKKTIDKVKSTPLYK